MEAGWTEIVRSVNRSWIYDTYFSLYRAIHPVGKVRGEMSGAGNVRIPSITYAHTTFDKFYPSSVTNCHKSRTPPIKYVIFPTYKLAIAKYNLNFKLMYNHLFIPPLNLWCFFKMKLTIISNFFLKACTTH